MVLKEFVALRGIPEEAHQYVIGPRTAIGWVVDQSRLRTDGDSGITLDLHDAFEQDPHAIVELLGQVVRVSIQTVALVAEFGPLSLE